MTTTRRTPGRYRDAPTSLPTVRERYGAADETAEQVAGVG